MKCTWFVDVYDEDGNHTGNARCGEPTEGDTYMEHLENHPPKDRRKR